MGRRAGIPNLELSKRQLVAGALFLEIGMRA